MFPIYSRQPSQLPRINLSNPITRNLVFCAVPILGGTTYIDLVTGVLGTPQGSTIAPSARAHVLIGTGGAGSVSNAPSVGLSTTGGASSTDCVAWPVSLLRGGSMNATGTLLCLGGTNVQNDGVTYPMGGNTESVTLGDGFGLQIDSFALVGRGNIVKTKYSTGATASTTAFLGNPFLNRLHFFGYSFNANGVNGTYFGAGKSESFSGKGAHGTTTTNRRATVLAQSVAGFSGTPHNAFVHLFLIWDRELTAAEYVRLNGNLWQIFQGSQRLFVPDTTAAAAGNMFSFNPPLRGGMRELGGGFQG